jgi:diguanylate cyclase (GGDEF)-like protein/PAS domain S-box-containing protein
MRTAYNRLLTRLPASVSDRYRLGMFGLGVIFLMMTAPYVVGDDAPVWFRGLMLASYVVIAARWAAWSRQGRPTIADAVHEFVAVGVTAYIVNDPFVGVTILWALACYLPVHTSRRWLATAMTAYCVAFMAGLALAAGHLDMLTDPQVITQPPTILFTGGLIYIFSRVLVRQEELLTENTEAVRLASANEHRFRSLVEALPGVILTSTPHGGIRYASPQLEPLLGFGINDIYGDWAALVERVIHEDDREQLFDQMSEGIANGTSFSVECRALTPASETIWIQLHSVLVDDGSPDAPVWQTLIFDVTERHSLTAQLTHQAFHDALTGLPNRLLFDDRVGHALERSKRTLSTTAVCFIDLDNFKIINDSLGHKFGDLLVVEVGQRLRECLRQGDTVARLGGDEFALLLEEQTSQEETIQVVERILDKLAKPFDIDGHPVYSGASIGIAYANERDISGAELIRHADVAMYEAKRRGKSRYEVFESFMETYALERMGLEVELRDALVRNEFRVVYQPIVELDTGVIYEVEALIRWQHPTRGLLGPIDFLPTAEETGLIVPIGRWVLNQACQQVRAWQQQISGCEELRLSVNLSPRQLHDSDLAADIAAAIDSSGIDPCWLQLEVAESAMLDDIEQAAQAIDELTALGVRIAIDDFGTGNSSLGHLRRLPVHTLKIDRSYVMELGKSEQGTTMLRAMVTLGKTLGMAVTAEGIETIEQTVLRTFGCDFGQGYYFARPLADAQMTTLLAERDAFPVFETPTLSIVELAHFPVTVAQAAAMD